MTYILYLLYYIIIIIIIINYVVDLGYNSNEIKYIQRHSTFFWKLLHWADFLFRNFFCEERDLQKYEVK